jgi:hypothetical protein
MKKQDPPPSKQTKKGVDWVKAVEEMKKSPGEFHLLGEFSPGIAAHMRSGKYKAFVPAGETDPAAYCEKHWEITSRVVSPGFPRVNIYCRWLG